MKRGVVLSLALCGSTAALEFVPIPDCTTDCHSQANAHAPAAKALVCQQSFIDFVYPCFAPLCSQEDIDIYTNDVEYTCAMYSLDMPVIPDVTPGKPDTSKSSDSSSLSSSSSTTESSSSATSTSTTSSTSGQSSKTAPPPSSASTSDAQPFYTTVIVTALTTYCPSATVVTYKDKTYTVTGPTTLTVTNCPCTITKPVSSPSTMMIPTSSSTPRVNSTSATSKPTVVVARAPTQQASLYSFAAAFAAFIGLLPLL
ncbi:hypothetical protein GQ53DRAFT_6865 [Thozetella sp. PMI_491]|nr:hypothetical protein GQ53DRAFT_6865 [Thozetella sp. PMI_491]